MWRFGKSIKLDSTIMKYYFIIMLYEGIDKLFGTVYVAHMGIRGLTSFQIGQVLAISSIALSIFDFPTGNIADKYGRKRSLVLGFFIWSIGLLVFFQANNLFTFILSILLWAVGVSLISGTPGAWFVDEITKEGRAHLKAKVFPNANAISLIFGAIVALLSSVLAIGRPDFPLLVAGIMALGTSIMLIFILNENYGDRAISFRKALVRNTIDIFKSATMRLILIYSMTGRIAFQTFVMIWQLYMVKELKLSTAYLGFTMAIFLVVLAVGNSLAGILLKRFEGVKVSIIGQGLIAIGSITIASHTSIVAFYIGACLIELGLGIDMSASSVWVHDFIPSERRASYISAISAAGSLFGFTIPLVSGYIADQIGFRYNWLLAFIGSIITITLLIKIGTAIRTVREGVQNVEKSK